ncbi:ras-related protein Rab-37-like isoform X2 [Agrilus planipennis]|uniref:small monomeric GTPase n=1 Tax=Agrilus planipennis TaxID=224129 RepID=A0A1W4WKX5_AGRPL|nr:ras-related protein Rab-37-like isoform X2 [Agrilus planipennis]
MMLADEYQFRRTIRVERKSSSSSEEESFVKNRKKFAKPLLSRNTQNIKNNRCDTFAKVLILGDSNVGKTCFLVRFHDDVYLSGNFISTVGVDFRNKVVTVDDCKVKLQIWDTAGQERFRSITHAYYRDAHALLLLYDVTNKTSFDNIRAWLTEIREYAKDDVVIMLIGNKCDCNSERLIRREDGDRLAREYNVAFMETSAKMGLNVDLAFMSIARELNYRQNGNYDNNRFRVQDYVREQTYAPSCTNCNV